MHLMIRSHCPFFSSGLHAINIANQRDLLSIGYPLVKKKDLYERPISLFTETIPTVLNLTFISSDVPSGFQSHNRFWLNHFCGVKCNVNSPEIHLWYYTCQPLDVQHRIWSLLRMHQQRWDLARIRTGNHPDRRRTRYHYASDPT